MSLLNYMQRNKFGVYEYKRRIPKDLLPKFPDKKSGFIKFSLQTHRIHKIPFELRLDATQLDKTLLDKLKGEASGILNWLLEGCMKWQELGGLEPPTSIIEATQAYREEMDSVQDFATDCLLRTKGQNVKNKDMYEHFKGWYNDNISDKNLWRTHRNYVYG